jgi:hypothetical protein
MICDQPNCPAMRTAEAFVNNLNRNVLAKLEKGTHGGKREGAGRKRSKRKRCPCGKMLASRAKKRGHRCMAA